MTASLLATQPFRIVSGSPSPRFLGLTAAERNRRVAQRAGAAGATADASTPLLTVPPGVVITADVIRALPPPTGVWQLQWDPVKPPLVWRASDAVPSSGGGSRALPAGAALDVSTASARWRSAWHLLRRSGKPTDGWLSRHVHRKISRVCSYLLLSLGVSANVATFLIFGVGVASGWLMAQTTHATMIAGAFLFWFASIADGVDGEMARLTLSESAWGERLDTFVDDATYFVAFAGVLVGWWRQGIGTAGAVLAASVAIALPIGLISSMRFVRAVTGDRVDTKLIEIGVIDAARSTRAWPLRMASSVFVLFRREAVALAFFAVSLVTDRRAVYPALLAAGLVVALATIALYRDEIAGAIRRYITPSAVLATAR